MVDVEAPQFPSLSWFKNQAGSLDQTLQERVSTDYPLLILILGASLTATYQLRRLRVTSPYFVEIMIITASLETLLFMWWSSGSEAGVAQEVTELGSLPIWHPDHPDREETRRTIPFISGVPLCLSDPTRNIDINLLKSVDELLAQTHDQISAGLEAKIKIAETSRTKLTGFASGDIDAVVGDEANELIADLRQQTNILSHLLAQHNQGPAGSSPLSSLANRATLARSLQELKRCRGATHTICAQSAQLDEAERRAELLRQQCEAKKYKMITVQNDGTCAYQCMTLRLMFRDGCTYENLHSAAWRAAHPEVHYFPPRNGQPERFKVDVSKVQAQLAELSEEMASNPNEKLADGSTWVQFLQNFMRSEWLALSTATEPEPALGFPDNLRSKFEAWDAEYRLAKESKNQAREEKVQDDVEQFIRSEAADAGWRACVAAQKEPGYWARNFDWFLFYKEYDLPVYHFNLNGDRLSETDLAFDDSFAGKLEDAAKGPALRFANVANGNHYDLVLTPVDMLLNEN